MRVTYDLHAFIRTTGMIENPFRLRQLGLSNDDIGGVFWPREMDDVLHFCSCNPQFHIVSYFGDGLYINCYDKRGSLFLVAEGDSDPNYMLNIKHFEEWLFFDIFKKPANRSFPA